MVDLAGIGTCEIHVFDVLPHFDRPGENTARGIHYHPWGLKSSYGADLGTAENGPLSSLQETMKKLGHEGRTIDVFKIDCEGCTLQWSFCRAID